LSNRMPPKQSKANKKTEVKKKEKTIDDKTFGLKNKKGGKAQKFIEQVNKQVHTGGKVNTWAQDQEKKRAADKKKAKEAELREMELLFGKAVTAKGAKVMIDPKAKSKKAQIYTEGGPGKGKAPSGKDAKEEDKGMEDWTEEQLREAVDKKHGKEKNKATTTDKICNEFIKAVETKKYGWFWECPKGPNCKYRHILPEGFVLESEKKAAKAAEKKNQISLEDLIERERAALGPKQTKITLETFSVWKAKKKAEKKAAQDKDIKEKTKKAKSGQVKGLTGRELFAFEATMGGDDEEAEDIMIEREQEEDDHKVHEINDAFFDTPSSALHLSKGAVPSQVNENRFDYLDANAIKVAEDAAKALAAEEGKGDGDISAADATTKTTEATSAAKPDLEVDEDLFGDDDLDDIDAELGDMALEDAGMN